jgi:hypothetical protein
MPIRNVHWVDENESRDYPVDEAASRVADDGKRLRTSVIADLSLRWPLTLGDFAFVSAVAVTDALVTVTIQAAPTANAAGDFAPLAVVTVRRPVQVGKPYALVPQAAGVGGWIAFGSGAEDAPYAARFSSPAQSRVTPRAARAYRPPPVESVRAAGSDAALTGVVTLKADPPLVIEKAEREIEGVLRDVILLRLSDDAGVEGFPVPAAAALITGYKTPSNFLAFAGPCAGRPESGTCGTPQPIEFVNAVGPDCDGRITIEFRGCAVLTEVAGAGAGLDCAKPLDDACLPAALPTSAGLLPAADVRPGGTANCCPGATYFDPGFNACVVSCVSVPSASIYDHPPPPSGWSYMRRPSDVYGYDIVCLVRPLEGPCAAPPPPPPPPFVGVSESLVVMPDLPYQNCFTEPGSVDLTVRTGLWGWAEDDSDTILCADQGGSLSVSFSLSEAATGYSVSAVVRRGSYETRTAGSRCVSTWDGDDFATYRRAVTEAKVLQGPTGAKHNAYVVLNRVSAAAPGGETYYAVGFDYDTQEAVVLRFNGTTFVPVAAAAAPGLALEAWYRIVVVVRPADTPGLTRIVFSVTGVSGGPVDATVDVTVNDYAPSTGTIGLGSNRSLTRFAYLQIAEDAGG